MNSLVAPCLAGLLLLAPSVLAAPMSHPLDGKVGVAKAAEPWAASPSPQQRKTAAPRTAAGCALPQMRPAPEARTYSSPAVDDAIALLVPQFADPNLGTLFANAMPNALDTTVIHSQSSAESADIGPYDTFIVTGDIDAMWQRDSTNQAKPYLRYLKVMHALWLMLHAACAVPFVSTFEGCLLTDSRSCSPLPFRSKKATIRQ